MLLGNFAKKNSKTLLNLGLRLLSSVSHGLLGVPWDVRASEKNDAWLL